MKHRGQGIVPAEEVASWMEEAGANLFRKNIREALGTTKVNDSIAQTLATDPEYFLYFHNGITVICESVTREFLGRQRPGEPIRFSDRAGSVLLRRAVPLQSIMSSRARLASSAATLVPSPVLPASPSPGTTCGSRPGR